jgi:hypothetical protein
VPSRAAAVVADFLEGHRPQIWVADRYAAQSGHGAARQLCLAHYADLRVMPTFSCQLARTAVIAAAGAA